MPAPEDGIETLPPWRRILPVVTAGIVAALSVLVLASWGLYSPLVRISVGILLGLFVGFLVRTLQPG